MRRRAIERHVLNRRERVADRDDVAAFRIGRVDRHRARFLEGRLTGRARRVVQFQLDDAVEAIRRDALLRHARAACRLHALARRVARFPVVDAIDELPREPVAEMPDVVLRADVRKRLAGRQVERMEERTSFGVVDLEVPQGLAVAQHLDARLGLFQLRAAEDRDGVVRAAALRHARD